MRPRRHGANAETGPPVQAVLVISPVPVPGAVEEALLTLKMKGASIAPDVLTHVVHAPDVIARDDRGEMLKILSQSFPTLGSPKQLKSRTECNRFVRTGSLGEFSGYYLTYR
jgi:hypothetical protein